MIGAAGQTQPPFFFAGLSVIFHNNLSKFHSFWLEYSTGGSSRAAIAV